METKLISRCCNCGSDDIKVSVLNRKIKCKNCGISVKDQNEFDEAVKVWNKALFAETNVGIDKDNEPKMNLYIRDGYIIGYKENRHKNEIEFDLIDIDQSFHVFVKDQNLCSRFTGQGEIVKIRLYAELIRYGEEIGLFMKDFEKLC
jgi:transcription initiation factor TFIIIB Brf1 subunit/transcription initiation factor TFIIB